MALLRELTRTRVSLPDGEPSDADRAKIKTQIKATLERLLDDDAFLTLLAEESLAEQKPSKGRRGRGGRSKRGSKRSDDGDDVDDDDERATPPPGDDGGEPPETERTLSGVLRLMHQQAEPLLPPSAVPEDHVDSRQLEQRLLAGSPADGAAGAAAERTSSAGAAAASGAGEYLLFGDSFVRLFGLVKHADIKIHAYKGATARGLSKEKNEHRVHIAKQLATRAAAGKEARAAVFVFGNVDVHFSYYYTRYAKKKQIDFEGIARDYVDFVAGLPAASRVIVGAYPSSITEDAQAVASLIPYSILTKEQAAKVDAADATLRARQGRVRTFNRLLAARCAEKGVSYHDTFDEMTVEEKDGPRLRPEYVDLSDLNIHVVWETTILLWVERLPWLKERAPPDFAERVTKSLTKYLLQKRAELKGKDFPESSKSVFSL